jgi:hypothetical protein
MCGIRCHTKNGRHKTKAVPNTSILLKGLKKSDKDKSATVRMKNSSLRTGHSREGSDVMTSADWEFSLWSAWEQPIKQDTMSCRLHTCTLDVRTHWAIVVVGMKYSPATSFIYTGIMYIVTRQCQFLPTEDEVIRSISQMALIVNGLVASFDDTYRLHHL